MYQEPLSVLIVDDEETFARLLAEQLKDECGFQTMYVTGGQDAIEALQRTRRGFDAILLDYMMPDLTGLNVLQWMHEQKNQTPVIILTAAGSETVAVEAMKFGAYDYLRKEHVDLQRIALAVQAVHERHQFRITKMMEEERWREIGLNSEATDKVRDVLNAITPKLNETFAEIATIIDDKAEQVLATLPQESHQGLRAMLSEIQKQVGFLETGVRGLLGLYRILYARHSETGEIERIKSELERQITTSASSG